MNKNFRLHMIVENIKAKDRKIISRMILSQKNGTIDINDNTLSFKEDNDSMTIELKNPDDSIIISIVEIVDVLGLKVKPNSKNKKIIIEYE